MLDIGFMVLAVVFTFLSFLFMEVYRIGVTSREMETIREDIRVLNNELGRLQETLQKNAEDHFVLRKMMDEAVRIYQGQVH